MYKFKLINQAMMTRTVELENEETGTIEICFDDSALISDENNFEFMKIGMSYNCKISLLGVEVDKIGERTFECVIINTDVYVGRTKYIEVVINSDKYYIYKKDVEESVKKKTKLMYKVSRKDLIQVDGVVHQDLLCDF